MALPLSVLDLVPLVAGGTSIRAMRDAVELARHVDALGYTRLWYAEHHNMPGIATTSPEILIAHVAPHTKRIRVGAGGVMLPNHAPLKVAEVYRLLEALHPGRIDLGLGRAPGTDPLTAVALRGSRTALVRDDFAAQLEDLRGFCGAGLPPDHPFRTIRAMPDDVRLPPIYLLGSSDHSARVAAELGLPFAFAAHFSPDAPELAMHSYRSGFRAGAIETPHAILALSVFCADTREAAERMASSARLSFVQLRRGRPGRLPSPDEATAHVFAPEDEPIVAFYRRIQIVGTPSEVRAGILEAAERTRADEVMVATHAYDPSARRRSYELVAEAFGLGR